MTVNQIYTFVNAAVKASIGETAVLAEDLSNVVDVGTAIFNQNAVDNYVKKLVDRIGRTIVVNRTYTGRAPSVLMDAWEFGSVLQKITITLPQATKNDTWDLTPGTDYSPNVFNPPTVSVKYYNGKTTFQVEMSITDIQLRESFNNGEQLNAFVSGIYTAIQNELTLSNDRLIMSTMGEGIGEAFAQANAPRAVNLLKLYNTAKGTTLTAAKAITDPDFIRFASYQIGLYSDRMANMSVLFNGGEQAKFTPKELQHIVLLSDFGRAADVYLQSDTFHNEFTRLPNAELVPYWQGSGTAYDFNSVSSVNVKTAAGDTVNKSGILGIIFDRDALGVANFEQRVNSKYNPDADFTNFWYKQDAQYFYDSNENFVVFYIEDPAES